MTQVKVDGIGAEDVLRYWFGALDAQGGWDDAQQALWFGGGAALDEALRARFGAVMEALVAGGLAAWEAEGPRGALAVILLCDQLSRNVWRGQAQAFALDPVANRLARDLIARSLDKTFYPIERVFIYLPLEHEESLEAQHESVRLFTALAEEAPEAQRGLFRGFLDYAHQHRDIIARFGRYPHRNAVLGRETTAEEADFLEHGPRFGQ